MKIITSIAVLLSASVLFAEPWTSNRYAQNCAGCHAPGRLNLPPVSRRCTLSCQGCHVNPNGGGLRNHYGRWNQQRWLRSFKNTKTLGHKNAPAPHNKQPYMKAKLRKNKKYVARKFKTTSKIEVDEEKYTNKNYVDWKKSAKDKAHFISRIPYNDPYRLERDFQTNVGGDLRVSYIQGDFGTNTKDSVLFPMTFDIGARIRPTREKYSAVIEARFANGPTGTEPEDLFEAGAIARSAYLIADDLWYNSYAMAGLFRPMFGNYNPDHTSLSNLLTGLGYKAVYKGLGIGAAPNVPFMNVNLIQPMSNSLYSQDEGVVVNVGGRFVTYGLSGLLSYWATKDESSPLLVVQKKSLTAATLGGTYKNFVVNFEFVNYVFEEIISSSFVKNSGSVFTLESKYKFWRENYLILNMANSNTALDHSKGGTTQVMAGVKSFWYPGVETELLQVSTEEDDDGAKTSVSRLQLQLHLSF